MIDEKIQAQLREKYNPDGSAIRDAQLHMLNILKCVDGICRKHNIPYWLSSGTLLGAVRHQGFIPWDNDIDIEMPVEDYKRFLQTYSSNLGYNEMWAKVRRNRESGRGTGKTNFRILCR